MKVRIKSYYLPLLLVECVGILAAAVCMACVGIWLWWVAGLILML
jgi:hypothetical protein